MKFAKRLNKGGTVSVSLESTRQSSHEALTCPATLRPPLCLLSPR